MILLTEFCTIKILNRIERNTKVSNWSIAKFKAKLADGKYTHLHKTVPISTCYEKRLHALCNKGCNS